MSEADPCGPRNFRWSVMMRLTSWSGSAELSADNFPSSDWLLETNPGL